MEVAGKMINDWLDEISQAGAADISLLIDELNDRLERPAIRSDEVEMAVRRLSEFLETQDDPCIWESVFNLFGSVSGRNILNEEIAEIAVKYLNGLAPACLVHAIPIIAESKRADKKPLLTPFLSSKNSAVRNTACRYMEGIQ